MGLQHILLPGLCRATKKSRGIGYVQFAKTDDADAAMAAMDGSIFQGRLLHVLPARKAPAPVEQPEKVHICISVHVAVSPVLCLCCAPNSVSISTA